MFLSLMAECVENYKTCVINNFGIRRTLQPDSVFRVFFFVGGGYFDEKNPLMRFSQLFSF